MDGGPSGYRTEQAMSAMMAARASLLEADPELADDEPELIRLVENQTGDAMDVLRRTARAVGVAEARAKSCREMIDQLEARRDRYERRRELLRAILLDAMRTLALPRLEAPDFTATRKATPPGPIVTDESLLPDRFFRITRTPSKTLLREAMVVDGEDVPGAAMSNGGETVSIRRT